MRLKQSVAVVTGGAKGIGGAISSAYSREGAILVIPDIDGKALREKEQEIKELGGQILPLEMDISLPSSAPRLVKETVNRFGRLDILVNNAGQALYGPFLEMPLATWQKMIDVDLTGYFLCAQAAGLQMKAQNRGKIINIASVAGEVGIVRSAAYSAAKAGVLALTRVMAIELAPYNIQVNAINPGAIMTELVKNLLTEEDKRVRVASVPAGRYGTPEDVAGTAVFLASSESDYITGTSIRVDGGQTSSRILR